ncbi:hypothetical protein TU51_10510 [Bacillus cytotoxicus]|nr:hypothetical protein TU51_10510 [Bacillus cytotoxicus]
MIDSQIENKGVFVGAHNMRGATIHEGTIINFGQAEKRFWRKKYNTCAMNLKWLKHMKSCLYLILMKLPYR